MVPNDSLGAVVVGPFLDWYPNPTSGFHLGGMFGVAALGLQGDDNEMSVGVGATLSAGYDFWVANQWSIGPELRLMKMGSNRQINRQTFLESTSGIQLTLSVVYH